MDQNDKSDDSMKKRQMRNSRNTIVGVLIKNSHIQRMLKKQKALYKHGLLFEANKHVNTNLYFFSLQDIISRNSIIRGTFYNNKKKKWEQNDFPYPNIIYKAYGSKNKSRALKNLEIQLKSLNIKRLNGFHCFDKWEVYQQLWKVKELIPHLPVTRIYKGPQSLREMFIGKSSIYLKGCKSGKGRGVMYIEKMKNDSYRYSYYISGLYSGRVSDFNGLIKKIEGFYKRKSFLIQTPIDLIEYKNRKVDLRAELQRDGKDNIIVVEVIIRIGKEKAPITTHGACFEFQPFLKYNMDFTDGYIQELKTRIDRLLNQIYLAIEKFYGKTGELSIDIGLDTSGNLWFIECNAYSAKVSLNQISNRNTLIENYINLLKYARYLNQHSILPDKQS